MGLAVHELSKKLSRRVRHSSTSLSKFFVPDNLDSFSLDSFSNILTKYPLINELKSHLASGVALLAVLLLNIACSRFEDPTTKYYVGLAATSISIISAFSLFCLWFLGVGARLINEIKTAYFSIIGLTTIGMLLGFFGVCYEAFNTSFFSERIGNLSLLFAGLVTAAMIVVTIRDYFRNLITKRNLLSLDFLAHEAIVKEDKERQVPAIQVEPGMRCVVLKGKRVPCDGVILSGACIVRERHFSGLIHIRSRGVGQKVTAGSEILLGFCEIEATSALSDSVATTFFDKVNGLTSLTSEMPKIMQYESLVNGALLFIGACMALTMREFGRPIESIYLAFVSLTCFFVTAEIFWLNAATAKCAIRKAFDFGVLFKSRDVLSKLTFCRNLAIDFALERPPGTFRVKGLELIDTRIEKSRLESALHAIFCACDDELAEAFSEYLSQCGGSPVPCSATNVREYPGLGISATVEGAEFSVGSEEFIIERGVAVEPSETVKVKATEQVAYVAIGDSIVAQFILSDPFLVDGQELKQKLGSQGIVTWLWSSGPQAKVDNLAKSSGFELGRISGDLDDIKMGDRINNLGNVALYVHQQTSNALIAKADLSIAHFDEIRWDIDRADISLMDRELWPIASIFSLAKSAKLIQLEFITVIAVVTLLLGVLIVIGGISPTIVGVAMTSAAVYLYLRLATAY